MYTEHAAGDERELPDVGPEGEGAGQLELTASGSDDEQAWHADVETRLEWTGAI